MTYKVDFFGRELKIGDFVARGDRIGSNVWVEINKVTNIIKDRIYLDDRPYPFRRSERWILMNGKFMYKGTSYDLTASAKPKSK